MIKFYGLGFEEVMNMDVVSFESLSKAMPIIEHQDMLINMRVASYPHIKKDSATRLHKEVYKKAFPSEFTQKKELTPEQAEKAMARFANG